MFHVLLLCLLIAFVHREFCVPLHVICLLFFVLQKEAMASVDYCEFK